MILNQLFYEQNTETVAKGLLGKKLVHSQGGQVLSGMIVETEAYVGPTDTACHASKGKTARTEVMFGSAGVSYVYLIYGMYYMLNVVTEQVDFPAAVLIRAIDPIEGMETMRLNRNSSGKNITNGPGKLCQAFGIDKSFNEHDLTVENGLWIESFRDLSDQQISSGPRIGISYASTADQVAHRRFWIKRNRYVSKS